LADLTNRGDERERGSAANDRECEMFHGRNFSFERTARNVKTPQSGQPSDKLSKAPTS
jgi:hypothetical protein